MTLPHVEIIMVSWLIRCTLYKELVEMILFSLLSWGKVSQMIHRSKGVLEISLKI